MNTKMKQKKKKAKERQSKEKVLRRRAISRMKRKEEREADRLEKKNRERIEPIMDPLKVIDRNIRIAENDIEEAKSMNASEKVIKALKHNLEILCNMREEYIAEQEEKESLNKELEGAGCKTLQEKLDYVNKKQQQAGNVGGSADVRWSSAPPKKRKPLHLRKETASCEVIKAKDRKD